MATSEAPLDTLSLDAIIFDLGGVILPLDYERTRSELGRLFGEGAYLAFSRLAQSELFDAFERGELDRDHFWREFASTLGSPPPAKEMLGIFDDAYSALLLPLPARQLEHLRHLGQKTRIFLLSNTNEIHVERFFEDLWRDHGLSETAFGSYFEAAHYSHRLGMRKPEARIYEHVLRVHGLSPERTAFIDDNPDNVREALALGIHARHHRHNAPLEETLGSWLS